MPKDVTEFFLVMVLWWFASITAKMMFVGSKSDYSPRINLILMITLFPATLGCWALPIYEIAFGSMSFWWVVICMFAGLLIGKFFANIMQKTTTTLVLANPTAIVCSIAGTIVAIAYL